MFNWMIGIVHFVGCWIILSSFDYHWGLFWLWCKQVFWSFKFLIIRFVRQDWSNIQCRDNYSLLLQEHLNTLLMSYEWDFSAWLVGTGTVTGCVSAGYYCYEAGSLCTSYQLEFGEMEYLFMQQVTWNQFITYGQAATDHRTLVCIAGCPRLRETSWNRWSFDCVCIICTAIEGPWKVVYPRFYTLGQYDTLG